MWEVSIRFLKSHTYVGYDHPTRWDPLELNWDNTGIFFENSPFNQSEKYNISFKDNIEIL